MPRYQYRCKECGLISNFTHLSDEVETDCLHCNEKDTLKKVLTTFTTKKVGTKSNKVGQVTEKFIEDSRNELEQQKNKLNRNR